LLHAAYKITGMPWEKLMNDVPLAFLYQCETLYALQMGYEAIKPGESTSKIRSDLLEGLRAVLGKEYGTAS
jgi:hypothetical protein